MPSGSSGLRMRESSGKSGAISAAGDPVTFT